MGLSNQTNLNVLFWCVPAYPAFLSTLKRPLQEIAGHKLSDAVIERLPTLCTLSPGQKISYSEVIAFHNVIRGESSITIALHVAI